MDKTIFALVLTIFLAIVGVVGDFFINLAGEGKKFIEIKYFIIGFVVYALTAFGWFFVMKYEKLSTLGVFYAITTVVFLTIISVFYFKEAINAYEVAGIVLAVISLVLMGRFA